MPTGVPNHGPPQKGAPTAGTKKATPPKPKVACFYINDTTDADNEHAALVWGLSMRHLAPRVDLRAKYVAEVRSVSLETELVAGKFLLVQGLTKILFRTGANGARHGLITQLVKTQPQAWTVDFAYVCEQHASQASVTLVRGDLTRHHIDRVVGGWPAGDITRVIAAEALPEAKGGPLRYEAYLSPVERMFLKPVLERWGSSEDRDACKNELRSLLGWCVRPGNGPLDDQILCAELTLLDYLESMRAFGCWSGIDFFLDVEHAGQIKTVLNHKAHHPEYLVCRSNEEVTTYQTAIDSKEAPDKKAQTIRTMLQGARDRKVAQKTADGKPRLPTVYQLNGKGSNTTRDQIIKTIDWADEVFIFNGASLSVVSDIISHCRQNPAAADKITLCMQGAAYNPRHNLTNNPFNYDLNPAASKSLLNYQRTSENPLKKCVLVTTEAGKQVAFAIDELADFRPNFQGPDKQGKIQPLPGLAHPFVGLRSAVFGYDIHRLGPQNKIMAFNTARAGAPWLATLKEVFKNDMKNPVRSPDMVAILAMFSPSFNRSYRHADGIYDHPQALSIEQGARGAMMIKFLTHPAAAGSQTEFDLRAGRFEVWMPKFAHGTRDVGAAPAYACTGLRGFVKEAVEAMAARSWNAPAAGGAQEQAASTTAAATTVVTTRAPVAVARQVNAAGGVSPTAAVPRPGLPLAGAPRPTTAQASQPRARQAVQQQQAGHQTGLKRPGSSGGPTSQLQHQALAATMTTPPPRRAPAGGVSSSNSSSSTSSTAHRSPQPLRREVRSEVASAGHGVDQRAPPSGGQRGSNREAR